MWVFPFLNIYGLVGETSGITQPVVVFPNGQVLPNLMSIITGSVMEEV